MVYILRVQSPNGTKRVQFPSVEKATWKDLQDQISQLFSVSPSQQLLSIRPLHNPEFVVADPNQSLPALGFKHGDMLYLSQPLNQSKEKQSSEDSSHKLTPLCQHGPKGRCIHCDAAPIGYKPSGKCTHGFGATCPNCSEHVKSQSTEIAPWLCNHPDYAFCPKCQPPEDEDEIKAKENEKLKVKFIPYAQLMAEKRALCKFKHDDSKTCLSCSPPVELSYKGNYNCRNGHRPWPLGMCSKCRPPNAVIRMQKYRHCDGISFKDISAGERFSSLWLGNPGLQRAGLLFGNYIDEPAKSKNFGAIRAEVYGIYMPPQEALPDGVIFLEDQYEDDIRQVCSSMNLLPIGWIVTTLPRSTKENQPMFLSGREIRQAAQFQQRYSDEYGHSRFVTMVLQYNAEGALEPTAFQVSDQGVAMERDGLLQDGTCPENLAARKSKAGDYIASIIFKDRAVDPGKDFVPDELLVNVIASKPYKPESIFLYHEFPLNSPSLNDFRRFVTIHQAEEYHIRFSDFNALCYLPRVVGLDLAVDVATAVRSKKPVSNNTKVSLDMKLSQYISKR